ncbi:hypothetical protein EJB05_37009, partial [Eragrostis curvula]
MPDRREEDGTPAAAIAGGEDHISALPDDLLHLILSPLPSDQALCEFAQLWIRHVLTVCRVRVLKVWVRTYRRLRLDTTPFASPVLTRLNLRDVSLMFDRWQREGPRLFHPLDFSNCPALKYLTMTSCKIHVSAIVSKTLTWLSVVECHFHSKFRTCVSASCVEWMELSICSGRAPILDNMPNLEAADVRLENDYYDCCENGDDSGDCKDDECRGCLGSSDTSSVLLASLSGATDLELMSDPHQYIFPRDCKSCIIFEKLGTLVLNDWCMRPEFAGLVFFLRYSPVLKKLTLQLEYCEKEQAVVVTDDQYTPTEHFLVSEKLKTVKIKCPEENELVKKLFVILRTYGVPPEHIRIKQNFIPPDVGYENSGSDYDW